jgi:hypothetical protein
MPYSDNLYPGDFNFPVPSFHQAVTPPDVDPDEGDTILVAYNPEWSPVLAAACNQMLQYYSWLGDVEQRKLAVGRATNLKIQLMTPVEVSDEIPAPYWDTEEDVDDSLPPDEQDWYGYVESATAPAGEMTFVQSAVIWILTGFVALVLSPTLPVGAAAAVTFRTLATRFTLAFNRGDVREQFRVIVDASDYETVDTDGLATGEIIEINVDGLEEAAFHDIMIVRTTP